MNPIQEPKYTVYLRVFDCPGCAIDHDKVPRSSIFALAGTALTIFTKNDLSRREPSGSMVEAEAL
jgi:hypothetical protein